MPCARVFWLLLSCPAFLAACGSGGGGGDNGGGGGGQATGPVTISGRALYQFPPPNAGCNGLNFNAVESRPIRQATIALLDAATGAALDSGVTDDNGDFTLTADPNTQVFIRVRAELKRTGAPSWDVEVRDNTITETATGAPLVLAERPVYVLDSAAFDSGTAGLTRDVTAATGWDGSAYTGTRAAAPFAILDTVYAAMSLVLSEDPQVAFEPLDVFWSVNNRPSSGEIDDGDIETSFYSSNNQLFLLGKVGSDADEFDDHVVAHEWGHYFEETFSRSDSIGGGHSPGDKLDMRVAFGEGFATALAGMALENPQYCDTVLSDGFGIDIEDGASFTPGWFNEVSVLKVLYDLWDEDIDGVDSGSIGFGPIYDVMTGAQAVTPAFTSIFTFATALKDMNPAAAPLIDGLLTSENIMATGINIYGDDEQNDAGGAPDVLPVYTDLVPNGDVINICSNRQFDGEGENAHGNKASEHRFLRMSITDASRYTFNIQTTTQVPGIDDPENDSDQSDPDILIVRNGERQNESVDRDNDGEPDLQGFSGDANEEVFTTASALNPGEYVLALVEFRYQDTVAPLTPSDFPARTCFNVSVSPAL